jgi:hypothetical protein
VITLRTTQFYSFHRTSPNTRVVVTHSCWTAGGFYGNAAVNIFVVPIVIGGICGLTYIYRRKTLQAIIEMGAAEPKALDALKVQLQQNLFFCIFLVYPTVTTCVLSACPCHARARARSRANLIRSR